MSRYSRRNSPQVDPIKPATVTALKRVLDPLIDLMFDAGVTVQEFNRLVRDRAVRIANGRVIRNSGRKSKSRVAIMTGLPRSEVTRILRLVDSADEIASDYHPAGRVLAGWHDNPRFLSSSGAPAVLPIFGKRGSFEKLVELYGGGIPVRAMLDELMQLNAVEHLADQKIQAKARVPVATGLTSKSITAVGERGRDLLETLAHNVRGRDRPLFEATAQIKNCDPEMMTVVRREISEQGVNFITAATALLKRSQKRRQSKASEAQPYRCGVTVFYFQDEITSDEGIGSQDAPIRRKNLRRQKGKPPIRS